MGRRRQVKSGLSDEELAGHFRQQFALACQARRMTPWSVAKGLALMVGRDGDEEWVRNTATALKRGSRMPDGETLCRLSVLLRVRMDWWFRPSSDPMIYDDPTGLELMADYQSRQSPAAQGRKARLPNVWCAAEDPDAPSPSGHSVAISSPGEFVPARADNSRTRQPRRAR
jgi:hypothetical protein